MPKFQPEIRRAFTGKNSGHNVGSQGGVLQQRRGSSGGSKEEGERHVDFFNVWYVVSGPDGTVDCNKILTEIAALREPISV